MSRRIDIWRDIGANVRLCRGISRHVSYFTHVNDYSKELPRSTASIYAIGIIVSRTRARVCVDGLLAVCATMPSCPVRPGVRGSVECGSPSRFVAVRRRMFGSTAASDLACGSQ